MHKVCTYMGRPEFVEYAKVEIGTDIVHGDYQENVNHHSVTLEDGSPGTMVYHWPFVKWGEPPTCTYEDHQKRWDDEILHLNEMQRALGPLSDDIRLIRAQIAMFRRCHYTFPDSILWICEGIGNLCPVLERPVGCGGRGQALISD